MQEGNLCTERSIPALRSVNEALYVRTQQLSLQFVECRSVAYLNEQNRMPAGIALAMFG